MANNVMARQDGQWIVVSQAPDVCKTPRGSSTPAVPYPVTAKLADAVQVVPNVRANGKPVVVFGQSLIPTTLGAEAGTAKGVKSGTVNDVCEPKGHSSTYRVAGKPVLRHGDDFWMNSRNTIGTIVGQTAPAAVPASQANPPIQAETPAEQQTGLEIIRRAERGVNLGAVSAQMGEFEGFFNVGLAALAGNWQAAEAGLSAMDAAPPPAAPAPSQSQNNSSIGSPGDGATVLGPGKPVSPNTLQLAPFKRHFPLSN